MQEIKGSAKRHSGRSCVSRSGLHGLISTISPRVFLRLHDVVTVILNKAAASKFQ